MGHGFISDEMYTAIKTAVTDRAVIDLGAGDLSYSSMLASMAAKNVLAMDKNPLDALPGVLTQQCSFEDFQETAEVAFLSWPSNTPLNGLNDILGRHDTVIYLGSNVGGSCCGHITLFRHLITREPTIHLFHPVNTLIIYGRENRRSPLCAEEVAGIEAWRGGGIFSTAKAEQINSCFTIIDCGNKMMPADAADLETMDIYDEHD